MVRFSINFRARPDSIAAGLCVGNRVESRMTTLDDPWYSTPNPMSLLHTAATAGSFQGVKCFPKACSVSKFGLALKIKVSSSF